MSSSQLNRVSGLLGHGGVVIGAQRGENDVGQAAAQKPERGDAVLATSQLLADVVASGAHAPGLGHSDHVQGTVDRAIARRG